MLRRKKRLIIYCSIILILLFIIYKGTTCIYSLWNKEDKTPKDKRLAKLDNINEKINYFNKDYINRYLSYKEKNPKLKNEEVIIHVNIGIDNDYYTNIKRATNLNKNTILVNKYNYLTEDYVPDNLESISLDYARSGMQLVREAKDAYEAMAKAAKQEKLTLVATSSYRSYEYQEKLYNNYVKSDGKEAADTYSGRPGFSEHQTGLSVDIYNGKGNYEEFDKTKEFEWVQNNAYKYGFILRFPKGKELLTGYDYESWHYRYVGTQIATYIHDNNLCFEEYYVQFIEKY